MRLFYVALLFIVLLSGCGRKGPLFLPRQEPAQPAASQAPQPASQPQSTTAPQK